MSGTLTVFVKSEWLRKLHLRSNSIFAMIDVVDSLRPRARR